jgi:hypothetical protein
MSLDDVEEAAIKANDAELRGHLALAASAAKVIGRVMDMSTLKPWDDVSLAERVGLALLVRVHNDLRCAALVGARGYPLQAATQIAPAFEAAYAVAHIGSSEDRAREWVEHQDASELPSSFGRVKTLIRGVLRADGFVDPELKRVVEREYAHYRQLCGPKHANPVLQRGFGRRVTETSVEILTGPDLRDDSTRMVWFALGSGVRLAGLAVRAFGLAHLTAEQREEIAAALAALKEQRRPLDELARERGWAKTVAEAERGGELGGRR